MKMPRSGTTPPGSSPLRLVATDLDGTLLRSDQSISERSCALLQELQSAGIVIVLVSARPPRGIIPIARAYNINGLALCSNGAVIYDLDQDRVVQERTLMPQQIEYLVRYLDNSIADLSFAAESGHNVICEAAFYPYCVQIDDPPPQIVETAALWQRPLIKILTHHTSLSSEDLYAQIHPLLDSSIYSITYSGGEFLEISSGGISKGEALAALCTQLNINQDEVVAFGDMPNDMSMLRWAGLSIAVANAHPLVLQSVDAVTLSNEEDGVAYMLEQLSACASSILSSPPIADGE
ncbi:hydrolase [Ktedonobacteria bacterium brp13]|nr:hydrolase [Ktedonobacteria bacterium brp13]